MRRLLTDSLGDETRSDPKSICRHGDMEHPTDKKSTDFDNRSREDNSTDDTIITKIKLFYSANSVFEPVDPML